MTPLAAAARTPVSTDGMYSRGIDAAGDLVDERDAVLHLQFLFLGLRLGDGTDGDHRIAELTAATGLLLEQASNIGGGSLDRLAVGDPGACRR